MHLLTAVDGAHKLLVQLVRALQPETDQAHDDRMRELEAIVRFDHVAECDGQVDLLIGGRMVVRIEVWNERGYRWQGSQNRSEFATKTEFKKADHTNLTNVTLQTSDTVHSHDEPHLQRSESSSQWNLPVLNDENFHLVRRDELTMFDGQ